MAAPLAPPRRVAFLFLGETLLIPHLYPIVEALAARDPAIAIDLWCATSVHEALLSAWSATLAHPALSIRRAPFFRTVADGGDGHNPPLPPKLPMLLALAPRLRGAQVAVCAELTSLWLPLLMPFGRTRFIRTVHGAGSVQRRRNLRRWFAWRILVPGAAERAAYMALRYAPEKIVATGYIKPSFRQRTPAAALFADDRPVILYAPHWQRHRSSWWRWGRGIVAALVAQRDFNVILAPHQRLFEGDPAAAAILADAARHAHVHADTDSFAMVDGSYTAAADLYLGDTSSQVVEFLARPRPCVFIDAQGMIDWRYRSDRDFWRCGDVARSFAEIMPALHAATARHARYRATQEALVRHALGEVAGAPDRATDQILLALDR